MAKRTSILKTDQGPEFVDWDGKDGHGRTGQIKKGTWFGKTIKVQDQVLNRGSLIDFLNSQTMGSPLKKGIFGFWGSSDKEILEVFNGIFGKPINQDILAKPLEEVDQTKSNDKGALTKIVASLNVGSQYEGASLTYTSESDIKVAGWHCLTPNQNKTIDNFAGIAILKENGNWISHLCPGGGYSEFSLNDFNHLMPLAIDKLLELKIVPTAVSGNIGRHSEDTLKNFQEWQKANKA